MPTGDPPISRRRLMHRTAATLLGSVAPVLTARASWPLSTRPITLVVPNPAGGEADNVARLVATMMARQMGQAVVVENVGGASGALAAKRVLRSAPDGHTLLFGTTSDVVLAPITNPALGYSARDFTPIALYGMTPLALVAQPGLQLAGVESLARYARARPDGASLSIGSTGEVSLQAFAAEAVGLATQIPFTRVPYRGGQALLNDLMARRLDVAISVLPAALRYAEAGLLHILGTFSPTAMAVPQWRSAGNMRPIGPLSVELWAGWLGPAGMAEATVARLHEAMLAILSDETYRTERARIGDQLAPPGSPRQFGEFLLAEDAKFRALAQRAPKPG